MQQRADAAACKGQELQELVKYNADLAAKVDDAEKQLHVRQAQWTTDQKATQQALHVARQQVAIASSYDLRGDLCLCSGDGCLLSITPSSVHRSKQL